MIRSRFCRAGLLGILLISSLCGAEKLPPFRWALVAEKTMVRLKLEVAEKAYLYNAELQFTVRDATGAEIGHTPKLSPEGKIKTGIYAWTFPVGKTRGPYSAKVNYQGCVEDASGDSICLLPAEVELTTAPPRSGKSEAVRADNTAAVPGWTKVGTLFGLSDKAKFLAFLEDGAPVEKEASATTVPDRNFFLLLALSLLAGLSLNLTPCVLPLIPVNLAIIAGSRDAKGKALIPGLFYGTGIAAVYTVLGLLSVLLKLPFGALNSSAGFNFVVAGILLVLSLALFGVFRVDFSSLQNKFQPEKFKTGRNITAFVLGGLFALLAGACVAPVLLGVLVWTGALYAAGNPFALLLPLATGIGMGLPYPVLGAGFAVLPRPGAWMRYVSMVFGVIVVALAIYFGSVGVKILRYSEETEFEKMNLALAEAKKEHRKVLLDFWASWCKNCSAMEQNVLSDPEVKAAMARYQVVKFRAEKPESGQVKTLLNHLDVPGFPAFVILEEQAGQSVR
ncbi:MAG: cytochrome c biogenesis protein CcdA [Victivallaceae bacterium]|nr:cytochrome c biogenesis protein CcdA [Victivallaceae bacterium]